MRNRAKSRRTGSGLLLALMLAAPGAATAADDKAAKARKIFSRCSSCHQIGDGAKNGIGPHLNGLDGRVAGTVEDFKYSTAMRAAGEEGLVWNAETLAEYLKKPRSFIKGTRMSFAGLRKEVEVEELVEWIVGSHASGSEETSAGAGRELLGAAAAAIEGDIDYGQYLAGECLTCHKTTESFSAIPSITGWPKENFIHVLYEYKGKIRQNPVMQTVAGRLGDEEMAALATYFGSLPPR